MSQRLEDLAKNNDHPSDKDLLEVKEMLSGPLKQLEETSAEIDRLEKLLLGLKEQRTKIEQSINRYSCILSPVRRVPSDILHTIFSHCLPTHRNPTMGASESPMLLTRVCSTWRSIALTSPRLGARLHIPFQAETELHSGFQGYPALSSEYVANILQARCHATRKWLSLSGDCPLSISISFTRNIGFYGQISAPGELDKSTVLLLEIIVSFSSRWRNLEVTAPLDVFRKLESMVLGHTLLSLSQLRASLYDGFSLAQREALQPTLGLLRSPNLERLSIFLYQPRINLLAAKTPSVA